MDNLTRRLFRKTATVELSQTKLLDYPESGFQTILSIKYNTIVMVIVFKHDVFNSHFKSYFISLEDEFRSAFAFLRKILKK